MKSLLVVLLSLFTVMPNLPAATLFDRGATWRWRPGTNEASAPVGAWRTNGFNDASFTTAPAPFWYGDILPGGTEITGMQSVYGSIFLRKTFVVSNVAQVAALRLGALVDDGFVAWINGTEVQRVNMTAAGAPGTAVTVATLADNAVEPVSFNTYDLLNPSAYLVAGTNVISVQVFQSAVASSDLGFDASLELIVTETNPPTILSITPAPGTINNLTQITVTFSEPVSGVVAAHLLVGGIGAANVTPIDSTTYTFTFVQPPYGSVPITWNSAHTIVDLALPPNRFNATGAGATWTYTLTDNTPPTVAGLSPGSGVTVRVLTNLTVIFSEAVSGVSAADLLINNNPAAAVTPLAASEYLFSFSQPPTGAVQVAWAPGHNIVDLAGNAFAGGNWTYRLDPNAASTTPYISEFMASNTRILADENGFFEDWIEVYNPSPLTLNLDGWYLTDNANNLTKWRFPATNLTGGSFLVVFASGNDRRVPGARLHTSFSLSGSGEYLALVKPDGTIASEYPAPFAPQVADVSYGFVQTPAGTTLEAGTNRVYFTTPTPGAANLGGTAVAGPSIESVLHTPNVPLDDQDLVVTARVRPSFQPVATVTLRYRIMFSNELSTPMLDDGAHGDGAAGDGVYGATIPANLSTNGQMIRYFIAATDVNAGASRWPLYTSTNSTEQYLGTIVNPTNVTSKLPIFHLFAPPTVLQPGPNTSAIGADSESGGRVAIFYDGEFYDNIYMELRGNTSAGLNKKAHRLEFNRGHEFRHAGPGGRTRKSALLAEKLDPAYLRQHLSFWFLNQIGVPAPFDYPVRVQLNGEFYQLAFHNDVIGQEQMERMGYDPKGALYKAVGTFVPSFFSTGVFQKLEPDNDPSRTDYLQLANGIAEAPNPLANRRATLFDMLDLPEVINHLAGTRWCSENDDVWANMSMYRDTFGDRLWRNIPFDMNASWGQLYGGSNPLSATNDNSKSHPFYGGSQVQENGSANWNRLYDAIVAVPETREMLARRQRSIMDQMIQPPGTPANELIIENYIKYMTNLISVEANMDRAKWGFSEWAAGKTFQDGVGDILNQFVGPRRVHWYVTHSITNTRRSIGIYATNSAGIPLAQPTNLVLRIGQIEFNPGSGNQGHEFIQITNSNPIAVDLSGWKLDGAVSFTFKPGTVIASNSSIYLTPDLRAFRTRTTAPKTNQGFFVIGNYQGSLDARGEIVKLLDRTGRLVHTNGYLGNPGLAQQYLRITEIMYHPGPTNLGSSYSQEEFEYIELKNIGPVALNLVGIHFTNGIDFAFTAASAVTNLNPGQLILLVRNPAAFISRHGPGAPIAGTFGGSLDNSGERIRLDDAVGEQILDFSYNNSWYPITDGLGFSLVIVDANAPFNTWDEKASWRASGSLNGSPGQNEPVPPAFAPVLVNEVLANSTVPEVDAIELRNTNAVPADIGGWWISDDFFTPFKFRVPAGTILAPGGYHVFTEAQFNPGGLGFAFSAAGDEVYLFSADAGGNLTGYYHGFSFNASEPGVTLGRHVTSDGDEHFVAQKTSTLTNANSGPRVGPVVISEIHYHPADVAGSDDTASEFVELQNISASAVSLFDTNYPVNRWKLDDAVDFSFSTNTVLSAGGYLVVVSFDPVTNATALAAFRAKYNVGVNVPIVGPYNGQLDNSEDSVELKKPDTSVLTNITSVLVDRVHYHDSAPWPAAADGTGASQHRLVPGDYGNDATNWTAALPSPGQSLPSGTAPAITQQPTPATVFVAGSVAVSPVYVVGTTSFVAAASGPGLRYQWRFNNSALPGATNSTLVLTNIQFEHAGKYSLVAYNNAGSVISADALLTVYAPLAVVIQPASQNVPAGSTVNLGIGAVGVGTIRYQWRYEGVDIVGATNSGYSFSGANFTLNGNYSCRIQDDFGSLISSNAFIYAPPVYFTVNPASQNVLPGTNVTMNALALGFGPVSYQWQYEGVDIPNATNTSYSFTNAALASHGNYRVIATDSLGTGASSNAFIFVLVKPGIISHPVAQTVLQGGTARFSVIATGAPPLYYRWLRNGALWLSNQSPDLVITNCQSNGTFRVTVGNMAGTANSQPAGGVALLVLADLDRDGMADVWETNYFGLGSTNDPGNALLDTDGDGMINRDEYVAGTNPLDASSLLRIILSTTNASTLQFVAQTNLGYTLQWRTNLAVGTWLNLSNIAAQSQVRTVELNAASPPVAADRFYRIVTPIVP